MGLGLAEGCHRTRAPAHGPADAPAISPKGQLPSTSPSSEEYLETLTEQEMNNAGDSAFRRDSVSFNRQKRFQVALSLEQLSHPGKGRPRWEIAACRQAAEGGWLHRHPRVGGAWTTTKSIEICLLSAGPFSIAAESWGCGALWCLFSLCPCARRCPSACACSSSWGQGRKGAAEGAIANGCREELRSPSAHSTRRDGLH